MTQTEIPEVVRHLRNPATIRKRAKEILRFVRSGGSAYFRVQDDKLTTVAALVAEKTMEQYPDGAIPYHSRYRHFSTGGIDRLNEVAELLSGFSEKEQACRLVELVIVSVLLDAGAGPHWSYHDARDAKQYNRSEGLAVASLDLFIDGAFSSDPSDPLRADATGLQEFSVSRLKEGFQVSDENPLTGLDGRVSLIQKLSSCMRNKASLFDGSERLGMVVPLLHEDATARDINAENLLAFILEAFADIWPGRIEIEGHNLGDVWKHEALDGDSLIPFHKLSQWLTYSLLEPLEDHGFTVNNTEALTALAEYRNGGLFVDSGVLEVKDAALLKESYPPSHELIVEWRALTIALIDEIAPLVRSILSKDEQELSLARILEGGTWATGRKLAQTKRPDASPPISIISDGTVF